MAAASILTAVFMSFLRWNPSLPLCPAALPRPDPFIGHQLVAGIGRVDTLPNPIISRRAISRIFKHLLEMGLLQSVYLARSRIVASARPPPSEWPCTDPV